ncbi:branched-chain amino acid ABC transporter permease [Variovorax sp. LjRoot84]|uniref:branched-chain amino acid ABC transporter permease n=1 Tax=Variovorax sp. LjRoot84 TaxID=3342340 RepID=UPI003ED05656
MSAARWRRAMNARGTVAPPPRPAPAVSLRTVPSQPIDNARRWIDALREHIGPHHIVVLAGLLVLPFVASPFFTFQVAAQALVLGLIALSLTFLAGYGGMVSLAQMTVAGIAGYALAVLGTSSSAEISLGWPWWAAVPFALLIATIAATLIGWLSVRTEGIYTIMITLAIGVAFYYLVLQNYSLFNGFQGLRELKPPTVFGITWRDPLPFYFLALAWSLGGYLLVRWIVRTPFGIALQGIRDNPRRMRALGFHVVAHRVAAYALAGAIAAVGGILLAWYNALMSPGSVGTSWLINILVIAVLGGMRHPIGAFLGALAFVLLQTFAIDLIDRERFNLVIGGVFLAIVLFSPDGLLGLWAMLRSRLAPRPGLTSNQRRQP